jgi:anaerobic magnesium-protoporphyrin IX monomethyl ester cyclase
MDVLLIDPPLYSLKGLSTRRAYCIGLTSLAAYLRKEGLDSAVLSADVLAPGSSGNFFTSLIPDWLKKSAQDLASLQKTSEENTNNKDFLVWRRLVAKVRQIMPLAVGIPYISPLKTIADRIAGLVKEVNPDIKVIAGAFHSTFCPEEVIRNPDVDFVVRGEGEIPLLALIREIKKDSPRWENVPGIHYHDGDGRIKSNPSVALIDNLDQLPFPARDLVLGCDYHRFTNHSLITNRGCPYKCTFCCDKNLWGGIVRRRSMPNVIEEIKLLKNTYDINYIDIVDGTFTYDRQYVQSFCRAMIDNEFGIKWGCTARYDNLDKELLALMKKAGCYGMYVGLESGSNRILESVAKKETVERNIEVSKMIYDSGIMQITSVLLGVPDEEKEDIEKTLEVMRSIKTDFLDVNNYIPLPGTPLFDAMSVEEKQAINWQKIGYKSAEGFFSKRMTREELHRYQSEARDIADSLRRTSIVRLAVKMAANSVARVFR